MDRNAIVKEIKRLNGLLRQTERKPLETKVVRITHDGSVEKVSTREAERLKAKAEQQGRVITIIVNGTRAIN